MYYQKRQIEEKRLYIATRYVETNSTVRRVAKELNISKTTVHKRLKEFIENPHANEQDASLALKVEYLLKKNREERHKRGGNATKQRYLDIKEKKKEK